MAFRGLAMLFKTTDGIVGILAASGVLNHIGLEEHICVIKLGHNRCRINGKPLPLLLWIHGTVSALSTVSYIDTLNARIPICYLNCTLDVVNPWARPQKEIYKSRMPLAALDRGSRWHHSLLNNIITLRHSGITKHIERLIERHNNQWVSPIQYIIVG